MGKVTSLYGKTTGKIGSIVFATSGGETIAREYNPHVANPSTMAQVNQRARMKLMSQISASLAPSLAIRKEGLTSARNKFVKRNMAACYAENGNAQVSYENLQLTEGNLGLTQITANAASGETGRTLIVGLAADPGESLSRVVYNVFIKSQEGKLSFFASKITTIHYDQNTGIYFPEQFDLLPSGDLVIYAYGMIDTSERATAKYGELNVVDGRDIATLVATRRIDFTDYQFTQTRGATMGTNNSPIEPTPDGSVRVFATALGDGGTVSGAGTYQLNAQVTLVATPASGYNFVKWVKNGTNQVLSTSATWTFNAAEQVDAVAVFEYVGNETL